VRNGYTIKIINKRHQGRDFRLTVSGSVPAQLSILAAADETATVTVGPDRLASFRVFLTVPAADVRGESAQVTFVVSDTASGDQAVYDSVFRGPSK
jgi:hypothetical protein